MAKITGGVPVAGFMSPTDTADTYAVTVEEYQQGGYRSVTTYAELDGIPQPRLKAGMLVYIVNEKKFYQYLENKWDVAAFSVEENSNKRPDFEIVSCDILPTTNALQHQCLKYTNKFIYGFNYTSITTTLYVKTTTNTQPNIQFNDFSGNGTSRVTIHSGDSEKTWLVTATTVFQTPLTRSQKLTIFINGFFETFDIKFHSPVIVVNVPKNTVDAVQTNGIKTFYTSSFNDIDWKTNGAVFPILELKQDVICPKPFINDDYMLVYYDSKITLKNTGYTIMNYGDTWTKHLGINGILGGFTKIGNRTQLDVTMPNGESMSLEGSVSDYSSLGNVQLSISAGIVPEY